MELIEVSKSVVMVKGIPHFDSRMVCVALEDGLIFIDTTALYSIAKEFRQEMEKRFNKKTIALLLTHFHGDHFFGMGAFENVKIFASEKFVGKMKDYFSKNSSEKLNEQGQDHGDPLVREAYATAKILEPTNVVIKEVAFGPEGQSLIFRVCGGHTDCSAYAYFIPEKILITGDNHFGKSTPYIGDESCDLEEWIKLLKEWETMMIDKIVPGHNDLTKKDFLPTVYNYLTDTISVLKDLKSQGLEVGDVFYHEKMPKQYFGEILDKNKQLFESSIRHWYEKV